MPAMNPQRREIPFLSKSLNYLVNLATTNGDKSIYSDEMARAVKRRRIFDDSAEMGELKTEPILHESNDDVEKALRIQVLQIAIPGSSTIKTSRLVNGDHSPAKKDFSVIKARCRLTIRHRHLPGGYDEPDVLCSRSQICELKIIREADHDCRSARVYLPRPFHIPWEEFYVNREDTEELALADHYSIMVELESAGDGQWPPIELLREHKSYETDPRHWVLRSRLEYDYSSNRSQSKLTIRKAPGLAEVPTKLTMDIDLRWSAGSAMVKSTSPKSPIPRIKGLDHEPLGPLTNGKVNGRPDRIVNGHFDDDSMEMDEEDHPEEVVTPNRSLRHREKIATYNVKALSDKQLGRDKKTKQRRKHGLDGLDSGIVTWILPQGRTLLLESYTCIRCFVTHRTMSHLRMHLEEHPEYNYDYGSDKNGFRVAINCTADVPVEPALESDEEDLGVLSEDQDLPHKPSRGSVRSKSVQGQTVFETKVRDKKHTIPKIKQQLFDSLSKVALQPGSRVDPSEPDLTWHLQKHREIFLDYSDVTASEKRFICEWDAFILQEQIISHVHLPKTFLKFVREKAAWLVKYPSNVRELGHFISFLCARNVLDAKTVTETIEIINQARRERGNEPDDVQADETDDGGSLSPKAEQPKSNSGCGVCKLPVSGATMLICHNRNCVNRLYHDDCVKDQAEMSIDGPKWLCNECYAKNAAV